MEKVSVSSSLEGYPAENIVDEDARTAWVAQSNRDMEWAQVDLQRLSSIHAIQVNFDEYGANQKVLSPEFTRAIWFTLR